MKLLDPVIVGVAQVSQREDDPLVARSPLDLMVDAVSQAALDSGNPKILKSIDSVRVVRGMWGYQNPAQCIADELTYQKSKLGSRHSAAIMCRRWRIKAFLISNRDTWIPLYLPVLNVGERNRGHDRPA